VSKFNGVVVGEVIDLEDPENLGRIKVSYPHLQDKPSDWVRMVTPMGGAERGAFFRPERGEEVLVVYEQGEARRPYMLGGLWSKTDRPPADDGNAKENNWRFIRSRSGHLIKLDDTDGSELIEFEDKDGARRIVIDSAGTKIRIECDSGDVEVTAESGKVIVKAQNVEVNADAIDVTGRSKVAISAPQIQLEASGMMSIKAGGALTIEGTPVKIN